MRLSVPIAIADAVLSRLLPDFMRQHPKVRLSVQACNRLVDLLEEGVDVVVRGVGLELESSSLVQLPLCTAQWGLLASPSLLHKLDSVLSPQQLVGKDALLFAPLDGGPDILRLRDEYGTHQEVRMNVQLRSDNVQTLKQAALSGLGIASLPLYACASELAAGHLQLLLPQWRPRDGRLIMLYPTRRGLSPAVRALIDFIKAELPALLEYHESEVLPLK